MVIVDYRLCSFVKQGDNALGSVCPSTCLSVFSRLNRNYYNSRLAGIKKEAS